MSKPLVVNNKTFNYPTPGESPGWGEDATDWAEEVTGVLTNVYGTGDIRTSSASISNDTTNGTVLGLAFDTSTVRSAHITYAITRSGTVAAVASSEVETGTLDIVYNGSTWEISRMATGDAGITEFTITSAGQVKYTSDDFGAGSPVTGYSGTMKFRAAAFTQ